MQHYEKNLGNPIINTANFFLHQLCSVEEADDKAMGGILCLWNDVRVADKNKTFPHNGMPEGLLGFAQSSWGGCIDLNALCRENGFLAQAGDSISIATRIHVQRDTTITAWIGFDSPSRSTRMSDGIGKQGQWENGGRVFVSSDSDPTSIEIFPPKPWNEPEAYRYHDQTWHQAPNELPYTDEQFFWMREPAQIPLKAGWNTIKLVCPCRFRALNWHAAFIPVKQETGRNISEATGLMFSDI